jgi:hypothetical protein
MSRLPARTGWEWVRTGLSIFRRQPGMLTALLVMSLFAMMLLSLVPVVGKYLAILLVPSFGMALMQACAQILRGERAMPAVALTGFRAPGMQRLCKLGVVYLGVYLLLTVLTRSAISPEFIAQMSQPDASRKVVEVNPADLFTMLGITTLQLCLFLALSFATPLTYWKGMGTFKAVFYSVFAVRGALGAFLVMLLASLGLFMAMSIVLMLIFGNGEAGQVVVVWLILMFGLLQQCAIYAAYHQIFGDPGITEVPHAD